MASSSGDNIKIVSEEEATAFCCRNDLQTASAAFGSPKELRYIVVDCGGAGTNVTVNALNMATSKISEIQTASGGPWGGAEIAQKVLKLIRRGIGEDVARRVDDCFWLEFERSKLGSLKLPEEGNKAIVELPMALFQALAAAGVLKKPTKVKGIEYRAKRMAFVIERDLIMECYSEVVDNIVRHVKGLLQRVDNIHCILVVGGLAGCSLIPTRMKAAFQTSKCHVICPINPAMSVVKGSVMYGQNPYFNRARVSKYSYGIHTSMPFKDGVHPEENRFQHNGMQFCHSIFAALVRRGDVIDGSKPITKTINVASAAQKGMHLYIYRSRDRHVRYTDSVNCECVLVLCVESPRVELGMDRAVELSIEFRQSTIEVRAVDKRSGVISHASFREH